MNESIRVSYIQPKSLQEAMRKTAIQIGVEPVAFSRECLRLRMSVGRLQEEEAAVGHVRTIFVGTWQVGSDLLFAYPQPPSTRRRVTLPSSEYRAMLDRAELLGENPDTYINRAAAFGVQVIGLQMKQGMWDGAFRMRVGDRNFSRAFS